MAVRSLIEFKVREGEEAAFERAYLAHGLLHRAVSAPGFLSGDFLRPAPESTSFWATALWRSRDDYSAWQSAYTSVFSRHALTEIGQFLSAAPQGFALEVAANVQGDAPS
ncbi:MAG: antibiotic biosynthesis monooxygenase family protein [Pseudomonadota bacterium]